jgi:hypothetical protein
MDEPLLTDEEQLPTDEIIFSHIGGARTYWEAVFGHVHDQHPELVSEWRYYKDGHRWLLKTVRKSKTIFWLSVVQGAFKITFYFGDKAEPAILASTLSHALKESFREGKRFGKVRAITVQVESRDDMDAVKALIEIKLSTK